MPIHSPMPAEEQEVPLIVQCHDLSSFELGHRWEKRLEQPPDCMSKPCDKVVQYKFGIVRCGAGMSLQSE